MQNKMPEQPIYKRYAWLFILLVALGGLFLPKLGLLLIPVMLTLMILGFTRGKLWCGHYCPHGSLFDVILPPLSRHRPLPVPLRSPVLAGVLLLWFMVMLGYRISVAFNSWGDADFLDRLGWVFVLNYLVVTLVGTALALVIKPRAWCMICPMGGFQRLLYQLGARLGLNRNSDVRLTPSDTAACRQCRLCDQACPLELEPYDGVVQGKGFAHDLCIRCRRCSLKCPAQVLTWEHRD